MKFIILFEFSSFNLSFMKLTCSPFSWGPYFLQDKRKRYLPLDWVRDHIEAEVATQKANAEEVAKEEV